MPTADPQQEAVQTVTGPVLETMDASNYTYVKVKTPTGEVWAASTKFKVAVGDRVTFALETPMENFHSPNLNRDFPLIYFASRVAPEGEPVTAPLAPLMAASHSSSGGAGEPAVEPVALPAEATAIADVWSRRKALAGKTVTVRGKVVKFNPGILGRNWVHLQDGSGKAADKTNDLTVTTDATVKVGDVVTFTGIVAIDQDFGAGYAYPVLLEKATLTERQ